MIYTQFVLLADLQRIGGSRVSANLDPADISAWARNSTVSDFYAAVSPELYAAFMAWLPTQPTDAVMQGFLVVAKDYTAACVLLTQSVAPNTNFTRYGNMSRQSDTGNEDAGKGKAQKASGVQPLVESYKRIMNDYIEANMPQYVIQATPTPNGWRHFQSPINI